MKKVAFLTLGILILATFVFATQITIYRWDTSMNRWRIAATSEASAEGFNPWCDEFTPWNSWSGSRSIDISVGITNNSGAFTNKTVRTLETKVYGKWMTDDVFALFKSGENISVSYFSNGPAGPKLIKTEKKVPMKKVIALLGSSNSTKVKEGPTSTFYLWLGANSEFQQRKPKEGDFMIICIVPKI